MRQRLVNRDQSKHSAFIRGLNVCIAAGWHGVQCNQAIQSCHVKSKSFSGFNRKPITQVPMCAIHHNLQHSMGEKRFYGDKLEGAVALGNALHLRHGETDEAFKLIARFKK